MAFRYRVKKKPALKARIGGWGNDARLKKDLLRRIGFEVEAQAKRNVPIDTGRLKGSIGTAWRGRPARTTPPAESQDAISEPKQANTVWVGSGVTYATHVEKHHRTKGRFLKRALDTVKGRLGRIASSFDSRDA